MKDIPNFDTFVKVEPIHKGWSNDKKYYVETKDNERAFTVGVKMEEEREDTLHMFDDEVEKIKHNRSYVPIWYHK